MTFRVRLVFERRQVVEGPPDCAQGLDRRRQRALVTALMIMIRMFGVAKPPRVL
jgi:hypothetical protein